jgi:hypothetical protein
MHLFTLLIFFFPSQMPWASSRKILKLNEIFKGSYWVPLFSWPKSGFPEIFGLGTL